MERCSHPRDERRGILGQAGEGMYLVETPEDVTQLQVRDPENLAYVTQTTLSLDDTARVGHLPHARKALIRGVADRADACDSRDP